MLCLSNADGCKVVVLDQVDLLRLQSEPLATPDGLLLLAVSPDLVWTAAAFHEAQVEGLSTAKILAILATAIAKETIGAT